MPDNRDIAAIRGAPAGPPDSAAVFASPIGRNYPMPRPGVESRPADLRRSEDSFVDQLFAAAPARRARCRFVSAPSATPTASPPSSTAMFEDDLPAFVNTRSPRVAARHDRPVCANGPNLCTKLRYAEISSRINGYYKPYQRRCALSRRPHTFASASGGLPFDALVGVHDKDPGEAGSISCSRLLRTACARGRRHRRAGPDRAALRRHAQRPLCRGFTTPLRPPGRAAAYAADRDQPAST